MENYILQLKELRCTCRIKFRGELILRAGLILRGGLMLRSGHILS